MMFKEYAQASADGTSDKYSKAELSQFKNVNGQDYHGTVDDLNVNHLTLEEKAVHNYLFNHPQYGPSAARQYLESLRPVLLYRSGEAIADNVDYPVLRELMAFTSGLENAATGFKQHFYGDAIDTNASEIAMSMLMQRHPDGVAHYMMGAAQSLGNMAPSLLVSSVTGQPWLGALTMGATSSGSATRQALQSGMSQSQARTYGLLVGTSEAALQYALGGIGSLGGKATGGLVGKLVSGINSSAAKVALKFGGSLASEVLEENLQNYLEPAFHMIVGATDQYDAPGMDEFIDTTLTTLMTTGLLESGGMVSNYQVAEFEKEQVKPWIEQALKVADGRVQSVALHLKGLLDNGEMVTPQVFMEAVSQISENEVGDYRQAVLSSQTDSNVRLIDIQDDSQFHMLSYDDTQQQDTIMRDTHSRMVEAGQIVEIQEVTEVAEHYPDLRNVKKKERNEILKAHVSELKTKLKAFLSGLKSNSYQFSVNGNILEAKIYDKGIREVTEKLTRDKANMLYQTEEIFQKAQYLYSTPDYENNPSVYRWNYFYTPVKIGEDTVGVRIAIRDMATAEQSQIYHWGIKKTSSLDGGTGRQAVSQTSVSSDEVNNSITQPSENVNTDEGLIYETLVQMGVHKAAAKSLAGQFDTADGLSAEVYAKGVGESFLYGMMNFSEQELHSAQGFAADLTEQRRKSIYDLGKTFSKNQTATADAKLQQQKNAAKKNPKKKGRVHYEVEDADIAQLTERQKTSIKALEKLANALGVDFYLYRSEKDAQGKPIGENGWYDPKTGDIHIDIDAGEHGAGTILFTAAHELSHFLHEWAPYKFKILADFLVEQYGKKGQSVADLIRAQQEKAKSNGRSLTWMQAYEEMVADSMETMLTDGKVMEKLALLKKKDKGLVQKIKEWFREFAAKLRRAYETAAPDTREGQMVSEMVDEIDRIQELFAEGLAEAGARYKVLHGQKNSASEGEVMYQLRQYTQTQINNWSSSKKIVIYNNDSQLLNFVDDAIAGINLTQKMYFGEIDDVLAARIKNDTGIDVKGRNVTLRAGNIRKILLHSHGNQSKEATRGQRAVAPSDFLRIVDVIGNPSNINKGVYDGRDAIVFEKHYGNERFVVFAVDSGKSSLDLFVQTLYVNVKKGNVTNVANAQTLALTSKTTVGTAPTSIIAQQNPNSNTTKGNNSNDPNSVRSGASVSPRYLLANALEGAARNRTERELLQQYKDDVAALEEQEKKLRGLQKEIHDISFAKGPRDKARLEQLKAEAARVRKDISAGDRRLLRLAASKPLKNLLERETARVTAETRAQDKATLKKYREETDAMVAELKKKQRAKVESRHKTAMRQKIKKLISHLNSLYSHGSKERNVKNGMKDTAASVLASAEVLFHDEFSNEDLIRNGIGTQLTGEENHLIGEYERLLEQRDLFRSRIEGVEKANGSEQTIRDLERMVQRINKQIAEKSKALSGVFERERNRINNALQHRTDH